MEQIEIEIKQSDKKNIDNKKTNYEVETIINKNLYEKKLITEDMYLKVNNKLLSIIKESELTISTIKT